MKHFVLLAVVCAVFACNETGLKGGDTTKNKKSADAGKRQGGNADLGTPDGGGKDAADGPDGPEGGEGKGGKDGKDGDEGKGGKDGDDGKGKGGKDDDSSEDLGKTATHKDGGTGDEPGGDSDGTSAGPDAEIDSSGEMILKKKVARIEVDTTVDHDSFFLIEGSKIFWRHVNLGVPTNTTVKFFGEDGKLLNTKNWEPKFQNGKGPNCQLTMRATLYCENGCDCVSDNVKLTKGHALQGKITQFRGRGGRDLSNGTPIQIHIRDFPNLSGAAPYSFTIE